MNDNWIGIFNIILGIIFILIGLKIYKPFKKELQDSIMKKFKPLFLFGGIGLLVWGIIISF